MKKLIIVIALSIALSIAISAAADVINITLTTSQNAAAQSVLSAAGFNPAMPVRLTRMNPALTNLLAAINFTNAPYSTVVHAYYNGSSMVWVTFQSQ